MLRRSLRPGWAAGAVLLLSAGSLAAQRPSIWIDALASSARPPAEVVDRTTGIYGLLGGRADWAGLRHSFDVGAYAGIGTRAEDGRWGTLSASGRQSWQHGASSAQLQMDFFGLHYTDPFQYTAGALTLHPTVAQSMGHLTARVFLEATLGGWSSKVQLPSVDSVVRADSSGPLRIGGIGGQLSAGIGSGALTVTGKVADAVNGSTDGTFSSVTAELTQRAAGWDLSADVTALRGPGFSETGAALRAGRALGVSLYTSAEFARVVTDPLFGSRGYTGATLSFSWRLGAGAGAPMQRVAVVGAREGSGRVVEFRVRGVDAKTVALTGSFTSWQPRAMVQRKGEWWLRVTVPPGTHQFGFLLDGETWYLPKDAPGVVDDGFGRRNATLIIPRL